MKNKHKTNKRGYRGLVYSYAFNQFRTAGRQNKPRKKRVVSYSETYGGRKHKNESCVPDETRWSSSMNPVPLKRDGKQTSNKESSLKREELAERTASILERATFIAENSLEASFRPSSTSCLDP